MRIVITNPTNWPYLRRGLERFINDLAEFLAQRGHTVHIVCAGPSRSRVVQERGFTTYYYRRLWHPWLRNVGILEFHSFFFPALYHLLRHRYDVVYACTFIDAFAALLARRVTGTPYVFTAFAIPPRKQYFRSLTLRGLIYRRAIRGADAFLTISGYVRAYFLERWGQESLICRLPIDTNLFHPAGRKPERSPIILCTAALDDPRKGGRVLMRAFDHLKERRPDLRLHVPWTLPSELESEFLSLVRPAFRKDIHFLGSAVDITQQYASASVTVLPSLWEALGLVLIESLASGTPVVCTRDGAFPEVFTDPRVVRFFEPGGATVYEPTNVEGLASALDECLELSRQPETARLCRSFGEQFSWPLLGPELERVLEQYARPRAGSCAVAVGSDR